MRVARGLSQIEVAEKIGRTRQTLRSYEREPGGVVPPPEVLQSLAELFEVPESMLREGLVPEYLARDAGLQAAMVREERTSHYGISPEQLRTVPGAADALLQMPDHVLELVSPFLGEMALARVSKEGRDRAETLLTELTAGVFTPGHPSPGEAVDLADAVDAMRLIREVYERRGVRIGLPPIDLSDRPDPDAVSGAEFTKQLQSQQRKKPKAG